MIAVIDYGMGNVHSVHKALQLYGADVRITGDPLQIAQAEKIILPGVGAFSDAMAELQRRSLMPVLRDCMLKDTRPFLGICLGMQLLFEKSQEAEHTEGLGIFKGHVVRFPEQQGLKIPHMGWNQLRISRLPKKQCPLFKGIDDNAQVYFCHSFYPLPREESVISTSTDYGVTFASSVWRDALYGVQFHPEKSQTVGLRIIKNFLEL